MFFRSICRNGIFPPNRDFVFPCRNILLSTAYIPRKKTAFRGLQEKRKRDPSLFPTIYIIDIGSLFQFPQIDLAGLFIKPQIAVVTGLFYFSVFKCGPDCTVRLLPVGTVVKTAQTDILAEVRKSILEILLQDHIHLIRIEG